MATELSVLLETTWHLNPLEVIQIVSAFTKVSLFHSFKPLASTCVVPIFWWPLYWAGPFPRKYAPFEGAHPQIPPNQLKLVLKRIGSWLSIFSKLYFALFIDRHGLFCPCYTTVMGTLARNYLRETTVFPPVAKEPREGEHCRLCHIPV